MPLANEALEAESRAQQVLTEGVEAVDRLRIRNGKEMGNEYVAYIRDALERCR